MPPRQEMIHSNQEWLALLRGQLGKELQHQAHRTLSAYLYRVSYNYLVMRQNDLSVLATFHPQDLGALAQEFVQEFLEKLVFNDYKLLDQFQGLGPFTAWTAVIIRRSIAKELKKKRWTHRARPDDSLAEQETNAAKPIHTTAQPDPHFLVRLQQIQTSLQACLQTLTPREQNAFIRCIVVDEPAEVVAKAVGSTSNAINVLVHKAKRKLRSCLRRGGIDLDDLQLFETA